MQVCVHSPSYLRCQSVVVCRLAGEQDVRETFLLPHHDVSKSTVAVILSHIISEPLVEHVASLFSKLPLYWAVQMHLAVGQSRTWHRGGMAKKVSVFHNLKILLKILDTLKQL